MPAFSFRLAHFRHLLSWVASFQAIDHTYRSSRFFQVLLTRLFSLIATSHFERTVVEAEFTECSECEECEVLVFSGIKNQTGGLSENKTAHPYSAISRDTLPSLAIPWLATTRNIAEHLVTRASSVRVKAYGLIVSIGIICCTNFRATEMIQ